MSEAKAKDFALRTLLKEKLIELDLEEQDKEKLIPKLVDVVARSGKLKNKKAYLRALLERERLGSTGIGNGVAIPHAKSNAVKDMVLAFAKSRKGVDFGALDGEKVFLFFMLASPQDYIGEHLKVLARISALIRDKFIVEQLKKAQDKKEIIKIITSAERAAAK